MPTTPEGFAARIDRLKADLVDQGRRVQALVERSFDAVYARDAAGAARVIDDDDPIDRADVDIERACVQLLDDATREGAAIGHSQLRAVLTIVKVNNELERTADAGVSVAEHVAELVGCTGEPPDTFRVMTNSVVGIIRDVNSSYQHQDAGLAKLVLQSEDAVEAFKLAILRDLEEQVASGAISVDLAFTLGQIAGECERISDYCTNVAEQVIYVATGAIVRHTDAGWVETGRSGNEEDE
ncbi:MAG: hypothetical protein EA378_01785 [Phycisphaerales bacterium]|nr:MAG: hypothetical protein EA378_01785 [Phycisphaerales bacterium]